MHAKRLCFAVLAVGIAAAACSSASSTQADAPGRYENTGEQAIPAASFAPAGTAAPATEQGATTGDGAGASGAVGAAAAENQIVKIGTISVQVAAIDENVIRATDQIHTMSGWLAGSDRSANYAGETASLTYRVPVARFEDALAAMRKLGVKVLSEHSESTPVGGQMVDLQARIDNLRAAEKAVQAIMDKAKTVDEVLTVQQRLTEIRGQIEELAGQLGALTDQAQYSTLTVVLVVPATNPSPTPSPSPSATATPIPWSATDQAGEAAGTLGEVGKAAATVLIWLLIVALPVGAAMLLVLILLVFLARIVDPYRKRLLPFTVAKPTTWTPGRPAYGPYAGMAPGAAPVAPPVAPPAPGPVEPPKL
ncbi:MAG TPA: DUF4349 domain-containing protein [Candidatus Limnocylindrales bacterium]